MKQEEKNEKYEYSLTLYVSGASPNSVRAISNIKTICEKYLHGRYNLEIIDIHKRKDLASTEQIIALPLLVKQQPLPRRNLIGDMSDTKKVLNGLGLIVE